MKYADRGGDAPLIAHYIILRANTSAAQVFPLLGNWLKRWYWAANVQRICGQLKRAKTNMHMHKLLLLIIVYIYTYNKDDFEEESDLQCNGSQSRFKAQCWYLWRTDYAIASDKHLIITAKANLFMEQNLRVNLRFFFYQDFTNKICSRRLKTKVMVEINFGLRQAAKSSKICFCLQIFLDFTKLVLIQNYRWPI